MSPPEGCRHCLRKRVHCQHPKGQHKEIARALREAKEAGFKVVELHAGHVWGKVIASNGQELKVWSTPRNPETMAKRIREFVRKYPKGGKK